MIVLCGQSIDPLHIFSVGVSLLTVDFISVERFITLSYPYRYQTTHERYYFNYLVTDICRGGIPPWSDTQQNIFR